MKVILPRMIPVLQKAYASGTLKSIDHILLNHDKWLEYERDIKDLRARVEAYGTDWRKAGRDLTKLFHTGASVKKDEKSLKTGRDGTRPRCIFASEPAKKCTLCILNIVNNVFKKLQPTMMSKKLSDIGATIFDDRVYHGHSISVDFSKFESTPTSEAVEVICRGMIPHLVRACPEAFESDILGPDLVAFLINMFMDDPKPWITIRYRDPLTGRVELKK